MLTETPSKKSVICDTYHRFLFHKFTLALHQISEMSSRAHSAPLFWGNGPEVTMSPLTEPNVPISLIRLFRRTSPSVLHKVCFIYKVSYFHLRYNHNHHKDFNIRSHIFLCIVGMIFYRYLAWKCKHLRLSIVRLVDECWMGYVLLLCRRRRVGTLR